MYRYKKILVSLSLGDNDASIIRFARTVANLARSESVHFVYSREPVEIPAALQKQYPWMTQPIASAARERAHDLIAEHFEELPDCKTQIHIHQKHPAFAALETIIESDIDLAIVGCEDEEMNTAIKLARKAPCSVLVAPKASSGDFNNICLGIDTSRFSNYVLDVGTAFAAAKGIKTVECLHCYSIPHGYHRTTMPREHFKQDLDAHSTQKMKEFLESQNLKGITPQIHVKESGYPGGDIHKHAQESGCELLIIGCRGKDALTASLLGSNAEDTIKSATSCAVLAVKEKGTGLSFLESLLGLKTSESLF